MRQRILLPVLFGLLVLPACASSGAGSTAGAGDAITREQLDRMGSGTLYEAVQRFHPEWLRRRLHDQPAVVFVDGTRFGDPSTLYGININHVVRVRYLDAPDATTRWGTGFGGGAIVVETRRGGEP